MILVLMGKSGVGKDTILEELTKNYNFKRIVSTTTREKREGEIEGKDYYFVSNEEFDNIIKENGFIEYVSFNGARYGCQKSSIDINKDMCIVVETDGAKALLSEYGTQNVYVIYLHLDDDIRFKRVSSRNHISKEEWEKRITSDNQRFKPEIIKDIVNFTVNTDNSIHAISKEIIDYISKHLD